MNKDDTRPPGVITIEHADSLTSYSIAELVGAGLGDEICMRVMPRTDGMEHVSVRWRLGHPVSRTWRASGEDAARITNAAEQLVRAVCTPTSKHAPVRPGAEIYTELGLDYRAALNARGKRRRGRNR